MKKRLSFKDQKQLESMGEIVTDAFRLSPETGLIASLIAAFLGLVASLVRLFRSFNNRCGKSLPV